MSDGSTATTATPTEDPDHGSPEKDFDAERKASTKVPVTFKLFGRDWHTVVIPDVQILEMTAAGPRRASALLDTLKMLVVPEERAVFYELCRNGLAAKVGDDNEELEPAKPPLTMEEIDGLVGWVIAKQAGRPITPSSTS